MFDMLIKSLGFEPEEFKQQFATALQTIATFDARLKAVQLQLIEIENHQIRLLDKLYPETLPQLEFKGEHDAG